MAKRGRRSIRNKRKSVKKYSSKRRSKTMRYLRGGVLSNVEYNQLTDAEKDNQLAILQAAHKKRLDNMTPEDLAAYNKMLDEEDEEDEHDGGGRRRYHRRKQSKSRSRKH
jgi:hypothetical protein